MPKFVVTHGSLLIAKRVVPAGQVFEAQPEQVEDLPNILPHVEGEKSLASFVEEGNKPSDFRIHLLKLRAIKTSKAAAPKEK